MQASYFALFASLLKPSHRYNSNSWMPCLCVTTSIYLVLSISSSNLASSGHSKASPDLARPGIPSCCFWSRCRQPWEWIYDEQYASLTGKLHIVDSAIESRNHLMKSAFCEEMDKISFGAMFYFKFMVILLVLNYKFWIAQIQRSIEERVASGLDTTSLDDEAFNVETSLDRCILRLIASCCNSKYSATTPHLEW